MMEWAVDRLVRLQRTSRWHALFDMPAGKVVALLPGPPTVCGRRVWIHGDNIGGGCGFVERNDFQVYIYTAPCFHSMEARMFWKRPRHGFALGDAFFPI